VASAARIAVLDRTFTKSCIPGILLAIGQNQGAGFA